MAMEKNLCPCLQEWKNQFIIFCNLYACSHIGLVDVGREYFEKMVSIYKIMPTMEHYGYMVDLFGHARELKEASEYYKEHAYRALFYDIEEFHQWL